MPKIPDWNAPAPQVEWLRWAQGEIERLQREIGGLGQSGLNDNKSQNATIDRLSRDVADLGTRVQEAFDALTVDMGQVTTGNLDQSRVIGTWTKGVDTAGTVKGDAGLTSLGVGSTDITALPGTRYTVWVNVTSGRIGQTASSITKKTNLEPIPYTASQFLSVMALVFEYIGQVDIRDNPENSNYNPDYVVPLEVGLVAEHLIAVGLSLYVQFSELGDPVNIDYATFGAHAALVIGQDHEARIAALEAKV